MDLRQLLAEQHIEPDTTLVLRHTPSESTLQRVLPWLAAERPELFNAYQSAQSLRVEKAMTKAKHVVSCIGQKAAGALFIGVYSVDGSRAVAKADYLAIPDIAELRRLGDRAFTDDERDSLLWFDLTLTGVLATWKGKLVIGWPAPQILWYRTLTKSAMPVRATHEENALVRALPNWRDIDLSWSDLKVIPQNLRDQLREWRGIYLIFDTSERKSYVGSASGSSNLLGRWENYAASGHGGNRQLLDCNPDNFRFTILERLNPDMSKKDVVHAENTWKERLHTRTPFGLNEN